MGSKRNKANRNISLVFGGATLLILMGTILFTLKTFSKREAERFSPDTAPRNLARLPEGSFIDLTEGWEFTLVSQDLTIDSISADDSLTWKPYDLFNKMKHADEIQGHYWLRKHFSLSRSFSYPSMVLGLISSKHRLYVNGYFVGGSDFFQYVAQYNIDPKILLTQEENTILIKAFTPQTPYPGIHRLIHVGVRLGDFGDIQRVIIRDNMQFSVLRTVYLVVTFVGSLFCLLFLAFNTSSKHLFYFSLYLLLGTLSLLYYNFFVTTALKYPYLTFIKVFSIGSAGFVLGSAFWFLIKNRTLELVSTSMGILYAVWATIGLLLEDQPMTQFFTYSQQFLQVSFILNCVWLFVALFILTRKIIKQDYFSVFSSTDILYQVFILASFFLNTLLCFSHSGFLETEYESLKLVIDNLGITHSSLFSLVILCVIFYEHILFLKQIDFNSEKDKFNLDLMRTLSKDNDLKSTVHIIQEKMCNLVGSERSTIYLVDNEQKNRYLEASHIFGKHAATQMVKKTISSHEGIIGQAIAAREPILVRDIDKLALENRNNNDSNQYKTKSCIILPLYLEGRFVGVLTVADKKNGRPFTGRDLNLVNSVAKDLALLCRVAKLQSSLNLQLNGIITALGKMIETRDPYTEFHSQGVLFLAERLAAEIKHPVSSDLKLAALLHDIGKIFVPPRILNKPGPLNAREREIIKKHSGWSSQILKNISGFEDISAWAGLHHERLDGQGYPYGLTGDLIPLEAQIIAVADFIDALSTNRSYRLKYAPERVEAMLIKAAESRHFNHNLVAAGVRLVQSSEFRRLYSERGTSYQPNIEKDEKIFFFYLEPFEDLLTSIQELRNFLTHAKGDFSLQILNLSKTCISRLNSELEKLNILINGISDKKDSDIGGNRSA